MPKFLQGVGYKEKSVIGFFDADIWNHSHGHGHTIPTAGLPV